MTYKELELIEEWIELLIKKEVSNQANKILKSGIVEEFHGDEWLERIKDKLVNQK